MIAGIKVNGGKRVMKQTKKSKIILSQLKAKSIYKIEEAIVAKNMHQKSLMKHWIYP